MFTSNVNRGWTAAETQLFLFLADRLWLSSLVAHPPQGSALCAFERAFPLAVVVNSGHLSHRQLPGNVNQSGSPSTSHLPTQPALIRCICYSHHLGTEWCVGQFQDIRSFKNPVGLTPTTMTPFRRSVFSPILMFDMNIHQSSSAELLIIIIMFNSIIVTATMHPLVVMLLHNAVYLVALNPKCKHQHYFTGVFFVCLFKWCGARKPQLRMDIEPVVLKP